MILSLDEVKIYYVFEKKLLTLMMRIFSKKL